MNIGILGASSQIAKDLILSFSKDSAENEVMMFSRDPEKVANQFKKINESIDYQNLAYSEFDTGQDFDILINFVGVGDPSLAKKMGAKIFEVTEYYDKLALDYLKTNPSCKYIFMSSGAVYGGDFQQPANENSVSKVNINNLKSTDWYTIAKLYAEAKHRAMNDYSIIDIRIFNYFSRTQDLNTRFLITDILRSIKYGGVLKTNVINITRDFITPPDFYRLILSIISSSKKNYSIDCYTKAPIDKFSLLDFCNKEFGLIYEIVGDAGVNGTGFKERYFSEYRIASNEFTPEFSSLSGVTNEMCFLKQC